MANYINRKVVLRNTMMLYLRMGISMVVSLYTSRVILSTLGVNDYGIYNIVGGIVVLFSFMNNTLTVAIRRFLAFELGKEGKRIQIVLVSSIIAVFLASLVIMIGVETIGTWILNNKMNIPDGRMETANVVFQFSVFTFFFSMNVIPYNSAIVAYEKMSAFAYIGIAETFLKLFLVLTLPFMPGDKLAWWGLLTFLLSLFVGICNFAYCRKKVVKVKLSRDFSWSEVFSIFKFSAWTIFGSMIGMAATQGVNIIYNIFYGVAVNAAKGVATQVSTAVNQFASNFITAFNPQLTKSYAAEGLSENTFKFVCQASRLTLILIIIFAVPISANIDDILAIWLTVVPEFSAPFTIIILICSAIDACSNPLYLLVYAKGKLELYQFVLSVIQIIYIVCVYILCDIGLNPVQVLIANVVCVIVLLAARLVILKRLMQFSISGYVNEVILPLIIPMALIIILSFGVNSIENYSVLFIFLKSTISFIIASIILFFMYMYSEEREIVYNFVKKTIKRDKYDK